MLRYLSGLVHGFLLCALGLGLYIYGCSFWQKLQWQLWVFTTDLKDLLPW